MTVTFTPDAAAKKRTDTLDPLAHFEALKFDAAMPEAWRSLAGTTVDQTRQAYEQAKVALEAGLRAVERSYDAAGQAASALNRKIMEIAQCNIDSGFDLAKSLASARNLAEIVELQGAYWRKQFDTLLTQAEEVRTLSLSATSDVTGPITRHAARQAERVQALSKKVSAETANVIKQQVTNLEEELRRAS
jgi:phasin